MVNLRCILHTFHQPTLISNICKEDRMRILQILRQNRNHSRFHCARAFHHVFATAFEPVIQTCHVSKQERNHIARQTPHIDHAKLMAYLKSSQTTHTFPHPVGNIISETHLRGVNDTWFWGVNSFAMRIQPFLVNIVPLHCIKKAINIANTGI